jgi:transposase-like protein
MLLPRPKRNFTPEYREQAVKSVIETSRPIAQVAKELGLNEGTLGNWVSAYKRDHAGEEPPLTVNEPQRTLPGSSMSDKFEFIDAEYADHKTANIKNGRQL